MATILTVDDSLSIREMVLFTLNNAGFDVVQACDGVEALEIAQKQVTDAVISDVNMPNMNGFELVKNLRKLNDYRYTPILMLTTESSREKKLEGKAAGATGWIVKPFNPDVLIATVNKIIG